MILETSFFWMHFELRPLNSIIFYRDKKYCNSEREQHFSEWESFVVKLMMIEFF